MSQANNKNVYKQKLLEHFHHPKGKQALMPSDFIGSGRNPMCGDEVEVGLAIDAEGKTRIRFRGRGCSVCLASASIMVETCTGLELARAKVEHKNALDWLLGEDDCTPNNESVQALDAMRKLPARKRCILLAWEALNESFGVQEDHDSTPAAGQ